MRSSTAFVVAVVIWLAAQPLAAQHRGIESPLTPYGMDATPQIGSAHGRCGTIAEDSAASARALANTALHNPDLYRRLVQRSKDRASRTLASVADDTFWTFIVRNDVTGEFGEVTAKLVYQGRRARIWIDVRDTSHVRKNTITILSRGLDTSTQAGSRDVTKGIIDNDEAVFGQPPPNRLDPQTPMVEDFLLTNIPDAFPGESVLGFFSPWDQGDEPGSNKANLLYIDSQEGLGTQTSQALVSVLSTVAHEYQHLIHFNVNRNSETFYNEGCSELASTLNGYFDRTNPAFLSNTNVELLGWTNDNASDIESEYERAMSFHRYLYEQYGELLITRLVATRSTGMQRLGDALTAVGRAADWKGTLKGFWAACYVQHNFADARYVFKKALSTSAAKITTTFADTVPSSGQFVVEQYGAAYTLFSFPVRSGMHIKFTAGQPYAVMAVLLRSNSVVEVRELLNGADNAIGETVGYDKIVLVVINLGVTVQTIHWDAGRLTSGVATADAGNRVMLDAVAPNPLRGPAAIGYHVGANGAPVTLAIYDLSGHAVSTLVDGELREPGTASAMFDPEGLPSGLYFVRLRQGTASASQPMMIVH